MSRGIAAGERIVGGYSLHAAIASGGMATVHLGRDVESGAVVAIKRLHPHLAGDPEFVAMFLDEARLASRIAHPNVVRTHGTVRTDDELFLVMEYVPGESLACLVRGKQAPRFDETVTIVRDALLGLHAAHEATDENGVPLDIVHRDVSPDNVLVGSDGIARLLDFGVAKAALRGQRTTKPGELKGKLAFMAPEHLRSGIASPRTDIYAMGVVLWEVLTGKRLFHGEGPGAIVQKILGGEVPNHMSVILAATASTLPDSALSGLSRLDDVVMRACALDPEERFETAEEMATALARAIEPAEPADVGAWVERSARDILTSRTALVAEIGHTPEPEHGPDSEPPTLVNDASVALLPLIVAEVAHESALEELDDVAKAHGNVLLPLLNAPGDTRDHLLEVIVPGRELPSLFLARPMGPPEPGGFPLALRRHDATLSHAPPRADGTTGRVAARTGNRVVLTAEHLRDLTRGAVLGEPDLVGRKLEVQGASVVLEERLRGGGGSAVYRARYTDIERKDVAVRVQHFHGHRDLDLCARFHAEGRAATKLNNRHLARMIDFGQEADGLFHVTMEYLAGQSMRQLLDEDGPMTQDRVMKLGWHVCAGLAHAHRRGVIHRDLKPSNVLIVLGTDDDGRPIRLAKVCDFAIGTGPAAGAQHDEDMILGTPQYMSPEQCRGHGMDARSDIYSCGVLLYELATGKLPFEARDDEDFLRLHQLAAPTPPSTHVPDIDPMFEHVLLKTLEKSPDARYRSMLELRHALKELRGRDASADPKPSMLPMPVSVRPSALPARPEGDDAPGETSLEGLVSLLKSLSEIPHANQARLAELERKTESLERMLKTLTARGDAVALREVIGTMAALNEQVARADPTETWTVTATACAQRLLHTVADPVALVPAAEKLLAASDEPEAHEALLSLLVWAKVPGAYALFTARRKHETRSARTRFVSAMRLIGAAAVPVVSAALEQLWPDSTAAMAHPALVVDLLRSIPGVHDEALGSVISRYAQWPDPEIQRAALATLVHVWGERATPALLAGMQSNDEDVRVIAVRGLRAVAAIDELVVRKIDFMIGAGMSASDELRIASAEALGYAAGPAREVAAQVVLRILREGDPGKTNAGAIAIARAALALAPAEAKAAIGACASRGPATLRGALLALL